MSGALNITASITPKSEADSLGINVGGLAVGASTATDTVEPQITADLGASNTTSANALSVLASESLPGTGYTAYANGTGAVGGDYAANAVVTTANDNAHLTSYVGASSMLTVTTTTMVAATNATFQNSVASADTIGLIAGGVASANAGTSTVTNAYLDTGVHVTGNSLIVTATGTDDNQAASTAGSGGVIAGAGAAAVTTNTSTTTAEINGSSVIDLSGGTTGSLSVIATHTAAFAGQEQTLAGGVLSGSGAETHNPVNSTVTTTIGGSASLKGQGIDIEALNHINDPLLANGASNILGDTGGLVSAAGATSDTFITLKTNVVISALASLTTAGGLSAPGIQLRTLNDIVANDKATLHTGGALAGSGVTDTIQTRTDLSKVEVGAGASLTSAGAINISARGQGTVTVAVEAETYGAATVSVAYSTADIEPADNEVAIDANAKLNSLGDTFVTAGTAPVTNPIVTGAVSNLERDQYTISARTDTFAGSAIPDRFSRCHGDDQSDESHHGDRGRVAPFRG